MTPITLPVWVVYATEPPLYGNQVVGVYDNEDQARRHAEGSIYVVARLTLNPPIPAVCRPEARAPEGARSPTGGAST